MALDIKTLRTGSTVLYKGERVEVWSIEKECGCYGITVHNKAKKYEDNMFHSSKEPYLIQTGVKRLDPIPITEELLRELGFEYGTDWNRYSRKYYLGKNDVGEDTYYEIIMNRWNDKWIISIFHYYIICETILLSSVKYLHELEQFVFMTCKTELISNN